MLRVRLTSVTVGTTFFLEANCPSAVFFVACKPLLTFEKPGAATPGFLLFRHADAVRAMRRV